MDCLFFPAGRPAVSAGTGPIKPIEDSEATVAWKRIAASPSDASQPRSPARGRNEKALPHGQPQHGVERWVRLGRDCREADLGREDALGREQRAAGHAGFGVDGVGAVRRAEAGMQEREEYARLQLCPQQWWLDNRRSRSPGQDQMERAVPAHACLHGLHELHKSIGGIVAGN